MQAFEKHYSVSDLGIPLGIGAAIPILLQNRGVSYAEQAIFSFAFYPFTCELRRSRKKSLSNC